MANHADMRNAVLDALKALPRPVTHDAAQLEAARVLKGFAHAPAEQFKAWFGKHGDQVLEGINHG